LKSLHELCKTNGTLLIADEVMTGFRLSPGGATQLLKLSPDIVCWGKIIGGGLPVGAYGGSANIMEFIAPSGPVYQAGTLSGNPLAMAAGIATLTELEKNPPYAQLEVYGAQLQAGLERLARDANVSLTVNRVGSMLTAFFQAGSVTTYNDAVKSNTEAFKLFFNAMLERGVYLPPSQFEAAFISSKHDQTDLEITLNAALEAFKVVAEAL
jgi:glutamate-1-semialdehyde 2,1-aminomutase